MIIDKLGVMVSPSDNIKPAKTTQLQIGTGISLSDINSEAVPLRLRISVAESFTAGSAVSCLWYIYAGGSATALPVLVSAMPATVSSTNLTAGTTIWDIAVPVVDYEYIGIFMSSSAALTGGAIDAYIYEAGQTNTNEFPS